MDRCFHKQEGFELWVTSQRRSRSSSRLSRRGSARFNLNLRSRKTESGGSQRVQIRSGTVQPSGQNPSPVSSFPQLAIPSHYSFLKPPMMKLPKQLNTFRRSNRLKAINDGTTQNLCCTRSADWSPKYLTFFQSIFVILLSYVFSYSY